MMHKLTLLDLSKSELTDHLIALGQPKFRANQIWHWLYQKHVADVAAMANLPQALRGQLSEQAVVSSLDPITRLTSTDGYTVKTLFALSDGEEIEAVLMGYDDHRRTLCISTQAGCGMACPFCATGQMGFRRNLTTGEIMAQVLYYARHLAASEQRVTNIVFMGMGEPLANYAATWEAVRRLNDPDGFGLGARQITISTVGVVPAMRRMSQEAEQVGLAVSLHAPTDAVRDRLVPINRRYPIAMLMQACRDYIATTRRRITFEYALMAGLNDQDEQADQFVALIKGMLCHVNLIPLNPTPNSPYSGSPDERVHAFRDRLQSAGIATTVRLRRGIDIQAGCGQLRVMNQLKKD